MIEINTWGYPVYELKKQYLIIATKLNFFFVFISKIKHNSHYIIIKQIDKDIQSVQNICLFNESNLPVSRVFITFHNHDTQKMRSNKIEIKNQFLLSCHCHNTDAYGRVYHFIIYTRLSSELYYVRDGVVNTYAMNFEVPVPANIGELEFCWQSLTRHSFNGQ
ncbi:Uncharacterized protein FWK35_00023736 [Aphis craccivora]|uniref:WIF domain-containing protein n=1 Tax=Aphis craccivora TaxID=307492 RepID=A0A6G0YJS9_APHCR|nr:Uncharacterized protein FWK35_00023736 [Aphis craccivora]